MQFMKEYDSVQVSIIIAVYNNQKYICRAIDSCLAQTMHYPYEIIIVDDGSTDNTSAVVKSTFGNAVRLIQLKENTGLANACNVGIHNAKGVNVVRVDSDDYIHKDMIHVEFVFMMMKRYKYRAISCDYYIVDDVGNITEKVSAKEVPIACGIMFNKNALIDIGVYDKNFRFNEDKDLMYRFLTKYKVYNLDIPLYKYRKHSSNITGDVDFVAHYNKLLGEKWQK